jgi:hypothetical protein
MKATKFEWSTVTQSYCAMKAPDGSGRGLNVAVIEAPNGEFVSVAIEANARDIADAGNRDGATAAMGVLLDGHAHEVIGSRKTVTGAKALAERYAEKWLAGRASTAPCPCDTIKPKQAKR